MEKTEGISRRSMLKASGAGLGLALAGCQQMGAPARKKRGPGKAFARADYHHLGLPTQTKHENERFLTDSKVYITDPEKDPFRIEWCRWLPDSEAPEKLKTETHIAFEVDDVEAEVAKYKKEEIFLAPGVPFEGVKVAFILYEGALIEFLQKTA